MTKNKSSKKEYDDEDEDSEYVYEYYTPRNYLSIFLAFAIPTVIIALICGGIIYDFYSSRPAVPFKIHFPEEPIKTSTGKENEFNYQYISKEDGVTYYIFQRELPYPYLSLFHNQKKKFTIIDSIGPDKLLEMAKIKDNLGTIIYKEHLQRDDYLCRELKIQYKGFMWCRVYYWRGGFIIVMVTSSAENKVDNNPKVAEFFNSLRLK